MKPQGMVLDLWPGLAALRRWEEVVGRLKASGRTTVGRLRSPGRSFYHPAGASPCASQPISFGFPCARSRTRVSCALVTFGPAPGAVDRCIAGPLAFFV